MTTILLVTLSGFILRCTPSYLQVSAILKTLGTRVKLNIVNLMKPISLYQEGMKPWVKSEKHEKINGVGWHRDCSEIKYSMNEYLRKKNKYPPKNMKAELKLSQYYFYTLSFTYEVLYDEDTIYFAHAVPYTYNKDHIKFLNSLKGSGKFFTLNYSKSAHWRIM